MPRRLLLGAVLLASPASGAPIPTPEASTQPRALLLVTMDTTRPEHLQPYGATTVATPVLAALAANGVVFDDALAVAPITLPAHAAILTGLYPPQTGVRNNGTQKVPAQVTTLAERLQASGWHTGAFVSASVLERRYGLDQGFEVYDDKVTTFGHPFSQTVPERPASATIAAARTWLDGLEPDRPWFLWVHLYDPHESYSPPPAFRDQYSSHPYDGEIAYMDEQIGRLLAHPKLAGNPQLAVVAVADHGESLGEHGEMSHGILAYDATLRVPLILKMPGLEAGKRVASTVSQVDLVPTLIDYFHLDGDPSLAGQSLMPLLGGRVDRKTVYAETWLPFYGYGWAKLSVLRRGRWKLIEGPDPELYDIERDPRELSNRIRQLPDVASDMKRDLDAFRSAMGSGPEESLALDRAAAERLRSLGYIGTGTRAVVREEDRPDPKSLIDLHVKLERARTFQEDGLYDQAETQLRAVLGKDANNLAALVELVVVLNKQGRIEEALQTVVRAEALDPGYARPRQLHATLEARLGRPQEALALFDEALARDPHLTEASIAKAYVLDGLGDAAGVASALDAALRDDAENPYANTVHAHLIEIPRGEVDAAIERLRKATIRDPLFVPAWQLLGMALAQAGHIEEAIDVYRDGLEHVPDDEALHAQLGTLLAQHGRGADAEAHLREAIRLSTEFHIDEHVTLGAWLSDHGRFEEAERENAEVLARDPTNMAARNNRAMVLFLSGHPDEAQEQLDELLRQHPDDASTHNNAAAIALATKQWERAEQEARAAVDNDPGQARGWVSLGMALDGQARYSEAVTAFQRALDGSPGDAQTMAKLAAALVKTGNPGRAAELFEQVLQAAPADAFVHLELGDLYFGPLSDPARARTHYTAVLRYAPNHPRAEELRARLEGKVADSEANPGSTLASIAAAIGVSGFSGSTASSSASAP